MAMIELSMKERPILLLGGGQVAQDRLSRLVPEGPLLTVLAPCLTEPIKSWWREGALVWWQERLSLESASGRIEAWMESFGGQSDLTPLVILATDDPVVNSHVGQLVRARGWLLSGPMERADMAFANASYLGGLGISLTTKPASPRLNALIRRDLEDRYQVLQDDPTILAELAYLRDLLKEQVHTSKERLVFWRRYLDGEALAQIRAGQWTCVKERLEDAISSLGIES